MQPGGAADDEHQRRMVPVELWRLVDYLMRKGLDEVRWGIVYLGGALLYVYLAEEITYIRLIPSNTLPYYFFFFLGPSVRSLATEENVTHIRLLPLLPLTPPAILILATEDM